MWEFAMCCFLYKMECSFWKDKKLKLKSRIEQRNLIWRKFDQFGMHVAKVDSKGHTSFRSIKITPPLNQNIPLSPAIGSVWIDQIFPNVEMEYIFSSAANHWQPIARQKIINHVAMSFKTRYICIDLKSTVPMRIFEDKSYHLEKRQSQIDIA